jgi:hypothetical protein
MGDGVERLILVRGELRHAGKSIEHGRATAKNKI